MTKDEYKDFALRYKGCGACFPMYHTLSRFEKMWFTAIQKDVAELEQENAELKEEGKKTFNDWLEACNKYGKVNLKLTKAKELLEDFICYANLADCNLYIKEQAEQFLSEVEK